MTRSRKYLSALYCILVSFGLSAQIPADLPIRTPSYTEDFQRYKSYPSMCLEDVYFGKDGELWLKTCGVGNHFNLRLFQFDGYEFRSLQHLFSELDFTFAIYGLVEGRQLVGATYEQATDKHQLFFLDLYTGRFQFHAFPQNAYPSAVYVSKTGEVFYLLEKDDWFYAYRWEKGEAILINQIQSKYEHTVFSPKMTDYGLPLSNVLLFDGKVIWIHNDISASFVDRIELATGEVQRFNAADFLGETNRELKTQQEEEAWIEMKVLGERTFLKVSFDKQNYQILELDLPNQQFTLIDGLPSDLRNVYIYEDKVGNLIYVLFKKDRTYAAILEDHDGNRFDYSSFFESLSLSKLGVREVKGEDFKKQLLICSDQGVQIHRVKSTDAIQTYASGFAIRAMTELPNGEIHIATQGNLRLRLNLATKTIKRVDLGNCQMQYHKFISDGTGQFWGALFKDLAKYDPTTNSCDVYPTDASQIRVFDFLDQDRVIFIDFNQEIGMNDLNDRTTTRFKVDGENYKVTGFVHDLMVAKNGLAWAVTTSGLYKIDLAANQVEVIGGDAIIPDPRFLCIEEDEQGKLWLGTPNSGIIIYDPSDQSVQRINSENGLANNTVVTITTDDDGMKWIGTYNGISLVSSKGQLITNLYEEDGVAHRESNRYAKLKTADGKIVIGSISGLTIIDPDQVRQDFIQNKALGLYLTKLEYFDPSAQQDTVQRLGLKALEQITLPAERRDLSLGFAISNYLRPAENKYAFKFVEDEDWTALGNQPHLNLKNIPAGRHQLLIRGGDGIGNWAQSVLKVNIRAQEYFYKQLWFYVLLVALGIGGALLWITRLQTAVRKATQKIRTDKAIIEQQAEELKALDQAKSQFFTNISHEFRTPLTIISGVVDQMKAKPDIWADKGIDTIKQHSENLLHLINQILDLRKLSSNKLDLNLVKGDILEYLRYITNSYRSFAENQGLQLHLISTQSSIIMDYDPDKLLRIISNLLSNAIKYNRENGNIYFNIDCVALDNKEWLKLQIQDTGVGIPEEKLVHIFDRFYQINEPGEKKVIGSGIGLALTHELVRLMKGEIEVKSEIGAGTTFFIKIPITRNAAEIDTLTSGIAESAKGLTINPIAEKTSTQIVFTNENVNRQLPTLLIVEDNLDIIQVLVACLEMDYQLEVAQNGEEGIEKAVEVVPDIIISDVMMPIKDGFELCNTLKQDERTSHIPIILLTAKSGDSARIKGLEKGADAYLSKPFNPEELLVRCKKLLELRQKLQERYRSFDVNAEQAATTVEDAFIQKVRQAVEAHIEDDSYGIPHLCRTIGLSRAQMHNKIKALTGLATSAFMRSVRLNKAKHLLQSTTLSVSEVACKVGFKNPTYFSSAYSKEFGESPSKTRK